MRLDSNGQMERKYHKVVNPNLYAGPSSSPGPSKRCLHSNSVEYRTLHASVVKNEDQELGPEKVVFDWRRQCGCIKTSDKLKQILSRFPSPPPPSPVAMPDHTHETTCISAYCTHKQEPSVLQNITESLDRHSHEIVKPTKKSVSAKSWQVIAELVQLVQLSVTATALALYYLIYCYMQLVYYTLRSALYFHHADGPMKITIGVVTVTSLVVGFNLLLRMERLMGILY